MPPKGQFYVSTLPQKELKKTAKTVLARKKGVSTAMHEKIHFTLLLAKENRVAPNTMDASEDILKNSKNFFRTFSLLKGLEQARECALYN